MPWDRDGEHWGADEGADTRLTETKCAPKVAP